MRIRLEISIARSHSSTNYPTCLKFELDEGTGLDVLRVTARRTFV